MCFSNIWDTNFLIFFLRKNNGLVVYQAVGSTSILYKEFYQAVFKPGNRCFCKCLQPYILLKINCLIVTKKLEE